MDLKTAGLAVVAAVEIADVAEAKEEAPAAEAAPEPEKKEEAVPLVKEAEQAAPLLPFSPCASLLAALPHLGAPRFSSSSERNKDLVWLDECSLLLAQLVIGLRGA